MPHWTNLNAYGIIKIESLTPKNKPEKKISNIFSHQISTFAPSCLIKYSKFSSLVYCDVFLALNSQFLLSHMHLNLPNGIFVKMPIKIFLEIIIIQNFSIIFIFTIFLKFLRFRFLSYLMNIRRIPQFNFFENSFLHRLVIQNFEKVDKRPAKVAFT
jgi:hypothetical protein